MVTPFPDLLVFSFFAPTLLRLAAAAALFYVAYLQWQRLEEIAHTRFPILGSGAWIAWVCIIFNAAMGAMLFAGYYTQVAALLSALSLAKSLVFKNRYPHVFPISRPAISLLLVVCISLMLTGAGAFAFDIRL